MPKQPYLKPNQNSALKPSQKTITQVRESAQRKVSRWDVIRHTDITNIFFKPLQTSIRLHKPRNLMEAIVYLFLIQLIIMALLQKRTNAQVVTFSNIPHDTNDVNATLHLNNSDTNITHSSVNMAQGQTQLSSQNIQGEMPLINHIALHVNTQQSHDNGEEQQPQSNSNKFFVSTTLERNTRIAKSFLNKIKNKAPWKLNRPTGSKINGSILSVIVGTKNSPQEIERKKLFEEQEHYLTILHNHVKEYAGNLKYESNKHMNAIKNKNDKEKINDLYQIMNIHLIDAMLTRQQAAIAQYFKGGNCNSQIAIAINDALLRGILIEKILVTNKVQSEDAHTFAIIGRQQNSKLEDPFTWGDNWVIIDFWAYDEAIITAATLREQPKNYAIYLDPKWKWEATMFDPNILDRYKDHKYAKKYPSVKHYINYCVEQYNMVMKMSNEFFYSLIPDLASKTQQTQHKRK